MGTMTLARQKREGQGSWEVEVSYGEDAVLHRHYAGCKKNPGHLKFIPVDQFNLDHLPPGYHNKNLVEYIRAQSDVTVRVSVKYVSDRRPETIPGSDKPYPCYITKGTHMMREGTGWVSDVYIYPDKDSNNNTCVCKECLNSPTPKTPVADIYIDTAAHVVYDDLEAADTTCHLFFDKGNIPDACSGVVTLTGMSCVLSDIKNDRCEMKCVTHDLDLAGTLEKMIRHRDDLYRRVRDKFCPLKFDNKIGQVYRRPARPLTIIVSHPHGCSKQVSVGHMVSNYEFNDSYMSICTYTTATCPGSSGARVSILTDDYPVVDRHHCGNCKDKELNCGYLLRLDK